MNSPAETGRIIRRYRQSNGLTQQALADLVGMPRTGLSAVEAGSQGLQLQMAVRIAEALKITLHTLQHGDADDSSPETGELRTFTFTRWSGHQESVVAATVEVGPGGTLIFRDDTRLVLAVRAGDWNNLREAGQDLSGQ